MQKFAYLLSSIVFLFATLGRASVPDSLITEAINKKLDAVQSPLKWREFVSQNSKRFPEINGEVKGEDKTYVVVEREEIKVNDNSFILGVGYRQTFIKAPISRVKKVLNSVHLFKDLFGLDLSAEVNPITEPLEKVKAFKARIYKHLAVISNQDYTLDFTNEQTDGVWFQRAKLLKDQENFALRDNLKALEEKSGGTVFREISIVYALKWYVRFAGPSLREIMNKELVKITDSVKCLSEGIKEPTPEAAAECWKAVIR